MFEVTLKADYEDHYDLRDQDRAVIDMNKR